MRPSTAPISPSVSGLARGVDPRIANNQSSWKMWHVIITQPAAFGPAVTSALCVLGDFQRSNFGATGLSDLQPN
jgi:hypothetical protein